MQTVAEPPKGKMRKPSSKRRAKAPKQQPEVQPLVEPDVDYYIGRDNHRFTPPPAPANIEEARFTVRQFEVMAELGMLPSRAELVDGRILTMPPTGNGHSVTRGNFIEEFIDAGWKRKNGKVARSQDTHRFPSGWCPEPDIALCDGIPKQGDLVDPPLQLVVEVSFETLDYDLGEKCLRYARENVPEYWVADLKANVIRVFRQPNPEADVVAAAWSETFVVPHGTKVSPLCLPKLSIDPADVLAEAGADEAGDA
jgi:Uma2 family endonuclease